MEPSSETQSHFPLYLPKPDEALLKWVGGHLKNSRGAKTPAQIAKRVGVDAGVIEEIERGIIRQDLGIFRHILRRGYGRNLEDILAKCYRTFQDKFNAKRKRLFARDYYYAVCLKPDGKKGPTPFFVGGDPERFLWAVPLRILKRQSFSTDLLELAPARVKNHSGETSEGCHDGVELIHVINGTITLTIDTGNEDPARRDLKKGDSIHFNSRFDHLIKNHGTASSALLLIVRASGP